VFKGGNIGDIACAVPTFIAVRRAYPKATITLLTSPGNEGIPGAKELLDGAWFIDELWAYHSHDIDSLAKVFSMWKKLRSRKFDLFVHVPVHDWTKFRTIIRNMFFAYFSGTRSAVGFRVRTLINVFRKTQIDYTFGPTEVESLLSLMQESGIPVHTVEFDLPKRPEAEAVISNLFKEKWGESFPKNLIAFHTGSKRREKQWPPERFNAVAKYLVSKHNARIVVLGGPGDVADAHVVVQDIAPEHVLVLAGTLGILETVEALRRILFLVSVDSGLMHLAGLLGKKTVSLFSILGVIGRWCPYGTGHRALYHRFLSCRYDSPECVRASMEAISVEETIAACERMIEQLRYD
jgi:ADP-heptose:LPS heptosyltransferase